MAQAHVSEVIPKPVLETPSVGNKLLTTLISLLIAFFVFLSIYRLSPPASQPATVPPTEFSSARALKHVESIARSPHPIGSVEEALVRDYILKELTTIGLGPEVQETTAVNQTQGGTITAGRVRNIVARLKGTEHSSAVMLTAHYDSVPTGPGAADDGSAVAALLEGARALKTGSPLKNDVIFLFTDGEEVGLLGAKAFVDENPAVKDVRLVLNFEARGNGGPAVMFETSSGNGKLIQEFAQAAQRPVANSIFYEIYKTLPNNTDLSIFKDAGLPGMNFAFIKGLARYHTQIDNIENLDERSLQHQGTYALSLARHFGDLDLSNLAGSNNVYFDLLSLGLIHYPGAWVLPIAVLACLFLIGTVVLGLRRKQLTFSGLARGFLSMVLSTIVAVVVVTLAWFLILMVNSSYRRIPQGDTYNSGLYFLAFVALTITIGTAFIAMFRKRAGWQNLLAGGLIWWAILMVLTSLIVPGASFLFVWPLLAILPAVVYVFALRGQGPLTATAQVLLAACAIPGVILIAPTIYVLLTALPLGAAGVAMLPLVFLLCLFIPILSSIPDRRKWLLPMAAAVIFLACLVAGSLTGGFDKKHPQPTDLFYGLNADTGKAFWGSSVRPDGWTTEFLTANPERGPLTEFFPASQRPFMKQQAQAISLDAPNVTLLEDGIQNDVRTIRLRITSPRKASFVSVQTNPGTEVLTALINGKKTQPVPGTSGSAGQQGGWSMRFYDLPDEGIELSLQTKTSQPVKLTVVDQTYGFPVALMNSHQSRPDYMMPAPFEFSPYSDSTLVGKSFTF